MRDGRGKVRGHRRPPYDTDRVGAVAIFGPWFREMFGTLLNMTQGLVGADIVTRSFEAARPFHSVQGARAIQ